MTISGTIIQLLTAPNPVLDLHLQPEGPVTQNSNYRKLELDHVVEWLDFTFDNIDAAYGHLFDIGPITSNAVANLRDTPTEIEKEAHVDNLTLLWNYQICREPMKIGAQQVQRDLGVEQHNITMKGFGRESKDPESDSKAGAPDWCIFLRDEDKTIMVWGDSKCSSKWSSNMAAARSNWIWPFRQVLTYCLNNATRYGYILTPEEIVLLRVFQDSSTPNSPWRVQYKSIAWENSSSGGNKLTVNLGIWALAMMSLNEGHRPVRDLAGTLPLNVWWQDEKDGSTTYEHHLSGRKTPVRLAGAEIRSRPDTIPGISTDENDGRRPKRRRG